MLRIRPAWLFRLFDHFTGKDNFHESQAHLGGRYLTPDPHLRAYPNPGIGLTVCTVRAPSRCALAQWP